MSSEFNFNVTSTSGNAAHIAIFVNPKQIVQEKFTLYSDMWPVAWKVFHMPAMTGSGDSPSSASHHYTPDLRAYVAGENNGNMITATDARDIKTGKNTFQVLIEGDVPSIKYDNSYQSPNTAAVVNRTHETRVVGVADNDNNPYISLKVKPKFTAEFKGEFEFAVCIVENITKGKQFSGQALGPWVSFMANTIAEDVTIMFDGSDLGVIGASALTHESTERVFTQSR